MNIIKDFVDTWYPLEVVLDVYLANLALGNSRILYSDPAVIKVDLSKSSNSTCAC